MDLSKTLTVYGRKPVLEALRDPTLDPHRLHLADKNKPGGIISEIETAAKKRSIPIAHHDRLALSRISKNGKQDQGVALDLFCPNFSTLDIFLTDFERNPEKKFKALLLDGITNPQNVGMIIRSSCAAGIDAIFYPKKSVATLGPLVIKASVGTAFRAPIVFVRRHLAARQRSKREACRSPLWIATRRCHSLSIRRKRARFSYWGARQRAPPRQ